MESLESRLLLTAASCDPDANYDAFGNEYDALTNLPLEEADGATGGGEGGLGPVDLADTFTLNSNLGAKHTIYLDFDGHVTSGTVWNSSFNGGADIITAAYDFDGDTSSFSDSELSRIQWIWSRVAEDFLPFDVNVTTQDPGTAALMKSGSGDAEWGTRVVIGGSSSDWYGASAGGVAYVGSFNWSSDSPVFVFEAQLGNGAEKYTAEAISHEVGHALGLSHDGSSSTSYYQGNGSGATSWAPIMGNGYYNELTQWSSGEYSGANNTQDDLAIITGQNGFGYRADDYGNDFGSASGLSVNGSDVSTSGVVEQNTDFDVFSFATDGGLIDLSISPNIRGANLDVLAELFDASGNLIASSNPATTIDAHISQTVAAGQYYLRVSGAGYGDPASSGYSDYASLGAYTITGTVPTSDAEFVSISATDAVKNETDSGSTSFTFTVNRSGNTSGSASVQYAVSGVGSSAANSSDFAGGAFGSGTVSFAAGESSKTIVVSVQGDATVESDEQFRVTLSNASGAVTISGATADGTIVNDDVAVTPSIDVAPVSGLTTRETGQVATFSVVLGSKPTADVIITVTSLDTTEGTVSTSQLTFTASNWNVAQTVTVTGVDDSTRDGNISYTVQLGPATSGDAVYDGMDVSDVQLTNQDNEKGKIKSGGSGDGSDGGSDGGGGGGGGGGGTKGKGGGRNKAAVIGDASTGDGFHFSNVQTADVVFTSTRLDSGADTADDDSNGQQVGHSRLTSEMHPYFAAIASLTDSNDDDLLNLNLVDKHGGRRVAESQIQYDFRRTDIRLDEPDDVSDDLSKTGQDTNRLRLLDEIPQTPHDVTCPN